MPVLIVNNWMNPKELKVNSKDLQRIQDDLEKMYAEF